MNIVEFNKQLYKIKLAEGRNVNLLEDYLLACLAKIEEYKDQSPTFQLFLKIYDEARNGPRVEFNPDWLEASSTTPDEDSYNEEQDTDWFSLRRRLRQLSAEMIHTREVRSRPDSTYVDNPFDWTSESGIRFYNGTTPAAILHYAATRFEGEYPALSYKKTEVGWLEFEHPLRIGISYE